MKTNEVSTEDTAEKLLPLGKNPVNLTAGKNAIHVVADVDVWELFAQHLRQQHESIIIDPNQITTGIFRDYRIPELLIDELITLPIIEA